jgi:hypothetical protein
VALLKTVKKLLAQCRQAEREDLIYETVASNPAGTACRCQAGVDTHISAIACAPPYTMPHVQCERSNNAQKETHFAALKVVYISANLSLDTSSW